jgi:hypothetical protein
MQVNYIINSHIAYKDALDNLLASMSYIDPSRYKIVIGGAKERVVVDNRIYVTHNSFDFTGIIDMLRYGWELGNWIMCLQDTMQFNPDTDALINHFDAKKSAIAVFGGQCNLVTYHRSVIEGYAGFFLENINLSKKQSIDFEGYPYKLLPENERGSYYSNCEVIGTTRLPNGNVDRIIERYTAINLLKYKANYGQTMEGTYHLQV